MVYEGIDVGTASKDTPTDVTDMLINPNFQQVFERRTPLHSPMPAGQRNLRTA